MLTLLLLLCHNALASPLAPKSYFLDIKATLDGKEIGNFQGTALEDEKITTIAAEEKAHTFVEVIAREETPGAVMLRFAMGTIDESGKRTITATPQIQTLENESASMVIGNPGEETSVSVTARPL